MAELLMAFCGLVLVLLTLTSWSGDRTQVVSLIAAVLILFAGAIAAAAGLRHRRQRDRPATR